jgi:hypothetical protein
MVVPTRQTKGHKQEHANSKTSKPAHAFGLHPDRIIRSVIANIRHSAM